MDGPQPAISSARSERDVVEWIGARGPALVAMSGGVDSALVASLAREALGDRALAVTVVGAAVAPREVDRARRVAQSIGIRHTVLAAEPLGDSEYRRNGADRCYHCRRVETGALRELGVREGIAQYLDGVHRDDLAEDRPGLRAMDEAGFAHPLAWAGWGKAQVREYARARAVPNWAQPSDACLASRVARGEPITSELLGRVAAAESFVLERGFRRVRVRVRDGSARVEVDPDEVARLAAPPLVEEVTEGLLALGFAPVSIDPRGYRGKADAFPMLP